MKPTRFLILTILFVSILFHANVSAQDYTEWHLPEGAKARLGKGAITGDIQYSPDRSLLAVPSSIGVWIYDADTHQEINLLVGHAAPVSAVAFSSDGDTLVSGSQDGTIQASNPHTGELKASPRGHERGRINSIAFLPQSRIFASGCSDKTVRLWSATTGNYITTLMGHTGPVASVAFSRDGLMLASGGGHEDNTIRLWKAEDNFRIAVPSLIGHEYGVTSVAFSPDGQLLVSGSMDDTIRLWDPHTGEYKATLTEHTNDVTSVAFAPNGQIFASVGDGKAIDLWDHTQDNSEIHSLDMVGPSLLSHSAQIAKYSPAAVKVPQFTYGM